MRLLFRAIKCCWVHWQSSLSSPFQQILHPDDFTGSYPGQLQCPGLRMGLVPALLYYISTHIPDSLNTKRLKNRDAYTFQLKVGEWVTLWVCWKPWDHTSWPFCHTPLEHSGVPTKRSKLLRTNWRTVMESHLHTVIRVMWMQTGCQNDL